MFRLQIMKALSSLKLMDQETSEGKLKRKRTHGGLALRCKCKSEAERGEPAKSRSLKGRPSIQQRNRNKTTDGGRPLAMMMSADHQLITREACKAGKWENDQVIKSNASVNARENVPLTNDDDDDDDDYSRRKYPPPRHVNYRIAWPSSLFIPQTNNVVRAAGIFPHFLVEIFSFLGLFSVPPSAVRWALFRQFLYTWEFLITSFRNFIQISG